VDALILAGELMLLHEADAKGKRFPLGWVLVWSGILATLAANVTYGAQYGVVGAIIWGWPAYSFILAAGGMVAVVKRGAARDVPDIEPDTDTPDPVDISMDIGPDIEAGEPQVAAPAAAAGKPKAARVPRKAPTGLDRAADIIRRNPGLSNAEVAKRARVSEKTVQRARPKNGLAKAAPRGSDPEE
jgi:hypothetical protein